jgi:hypothetical protein
MKKIFLLIFIILSFGLPELISAQGASFYFSPASGSYDIDQTFSVVVLINTEGAAINAAQATIYFPNDKLRVIGVFKSDSIFSLWTQEPTYSNSMGTISFGGGLPNPGFKGSAGRVFTISFQGKSEGEARVNFGGEMILANDAWGTDIFSHSSRGTYYIGIPEEVPPPVILTKAPPAPKISSPTHPYSDKWYNNNNPEFKWILTHDIIGVSTSFNQKSVFDPGSISEGKFDSRTFQGIENGAWYFHAKVQNNIGWSPTTHFKIQIDAQPPYPFEITIDNEGDPTNPTPLLYFEAEDEISGISHYEVRIGDGDMFSLVEVQTNPFRLPLQFPGTHNLEIRAVDRAGNRTISSIEVPIEPIPAPEIIICQDVFRSGEEILFIEGSALPNIEIVGFFEKDDELIKEWHIFSDESGNWSLKEEGAFRSGIYRLSVRAKNSRGAMSYPSKECIIKVILQGISLGPWIINYQSLTLLLTLLFFIGLIFLIYLNQRIKLTRETIKREAEDLKKKFYKEYDELKEDIKKEIEALKQAKHQRELTGKEKELEERLLRNLADVEKVIKEELKDIEEIE